MSPLTTTTKPLNLLIADKSRLYMDALKFVVQGSKEVNLIAACDTTSELVSVLETSNIDVLVIDTIIFDKHAVGHIKKFRTQYPDMKIISLSIQESILTRDEILDAGVHEYISKWGDTSKLLDIIKNRYLNI